MGHLVENQIRPKTAMIQMFLMEGDTIKQLNGREQKSQA